MGIFSRRQNATIEPTQAVGPRTPFPAADAAGVALDLHFVR